MPKACSKDCSVILFDVNTQCYTKRNLTKLILVNCDKTYNQLSGRKGRYKHIKDVCSDVTTYNPHHLIQEIENSGTGNADLLEAIHVGLKSLQEDFDGIGGIKTFQLVFITDLSAFENTHNDEFRNELAELMDDLEVFFYVIEPDVEPDFTIKTHGDVDKWMKSLSGNGTDKNLDTVKAIVAQIPRGVVCTSPLGWELCFAYKNWSGSQPWNVSLQIGSNLVFRTQTVKILDDTKSIRLKIRNRVSEVKFSNAEDLTEEINKRDVIPVIERHGKVVRMPENAMFALDTRRSFEILCFTHYKNVPEYMMLGGGCYCVLPSGTSEQKQALCVLIDTLAQKKKYAIARRVYNNRYVPKIVVLVPKPQLTPKCFYLTSLPFADDVKIALKEQNMETAPEKNVPDEIVSFLDGLTIDSDAPRKKVPLGINMMQSFTSQKIVNKAGDKMFKRQLNLNELDFDLLAETTSDENIENLKKLWCERVVDEAVVKEQQSDDEYEW